LLAGFSILICTIGGNLLLNLCFLAMGVLPPDSFWNVFWVRFQFSATLAMIFGMGAMGYHGLRKDLESKTMQLRDRQLEQERAGKFALEAQLASLESHIRPHFLFNTLNTISSLIPEDPGLAEHLVGKLAALLRLSLDSNQERVASLERELKIVGDYLEIERARYGNRLRFKSDIPPELRPVEVPALSLQTLVENSVKYAVGSRPEGAEIRIVAFAHDGSLFVKVSDDGPGFSAANFPPGHGLDNLQRRLTVLFGPSARLEFSSDSGATVWFTVPHTAG
jgi:LytS/YehU family sensor histidine kinase